MMTIDEYIKKRKEEDSLNEFDLKAKNENIKNTVNYVFEYYNGYLDLTEIEFQEAKESVKLANYRKKFVGYEKSTQDWLVNIYAKTGKYPHRFLDNQLKNEPTVMMFDSDAEFRIVSYDCYAALVRKIPFIKGNTEEVFEYIKNYKQVRSEELDLSRFADYGLIPSLVKWIENTYTKYNVNLISFAEDYCEYFYNNEHLWDKKTKTVIGEFTLYHYDYSKSKIYFNVGSLYAKMNYKPFIKGKRKELEALITITWFNSIESDKENIISDFIEKNFNKEKVETEGVTNEE